MNLLLQYAFALAANTRRYHFGGSHPLQGFDCSGFVLELLHAGGRIPRGQDMTAQSLYNWLEQDGSSAWKTGSLAFFGKDVLHVSHVGFCLDDKLMMHAGGGDATTTSDEVAIRQNAFVRVDPIRYRKDFLCVRWPGYPLLGVP